MTMPKFEPVAMIGGHGHPRHLSYLQSATEARLYGAMKPLYTAEQLTEAYEAGKREQATELSAARAEIERKMSAGQFVLEQLAAEQAKNAGLREVLKTIYEDFDCDENAHDYGTDCRCCIAEKALATKSDTPALEAYVTKAGEKMREKCSSICKDEATDAFADGEAEDWGRAAVMCSELISALPAITLGDLT